MQTAPRGAWRAALEVGRGAEPTPAMQSYLDWEYGLIAQLVQDGTHGFVI